MTREKDKQFKKNQFGPLFLVCFLVSHLIPLPLVN